jgi:hypothetical protein
VELVQQNIDNFNPLQYGIWSAFHDIAGGPERRKNGEKFVKKKRTKG